LTLSLNVYNADENSFFVTSTIVSGQSEAILIDAQFTLADAHRVVAEILASNKKLKAVYISYCDPDFYFGLEVVKQAFPDVPVYATSETVKKIKATFQKKLEFWGPKLGNNGSKNIIIPEILEGKTLEVDGNQLQIIGDDTSDRTFIYIPTIKAVLGSISVFGQLHLWMADAETREKREKWSQLLKKIESLNPETVIPAHTKKGVSTNLSIVSYNLEYLKTYEEEIPKAKDSSELIANLMKKYPESGLGIALDIGAKVNKGELKWG